MPLQIELSSHQLSQLEDLATRLTVTVDQLAKAAMEVFLMLNGYELQSSVDDAEKLILSLAARTLSKQRLTTWVEEHAAPIEEFQA